MLMSVTDENGESFGVEMTSSEALEIATICEGPFIGPDPKSRHPGSPGSYLLRPTRRHPAYGGAAPVVALLRIVQRNAGKG